MRLFIWSAFSSNHSSGFTVVGVFSTSEHAQDAADILNSLLRSIFAWYQQPGTPKFGEQYGEAPSPPERAIAAALQITWSPATLDWLGFDEQSQGPIKVVDNLLFIDGTDSELGAHPADDLIKHVGGAALVAGCVDPDGVEVNTISLDLSCTVPDSATAEAIEAETAAYLRGSKAKRSLSRSTPWASYGAPLDATQFAGMVTRTDNGLIFTGQFSSISQGFPALLAYLRDRGCTDFRYEFSERPFERGD